MLSYGCDTKRYVVEPDPTSSGVLNGLSNFPTTPDGSSRHCADDSALQPPTQLSGERRRKSTNNPRIVDPQNVLQGSKFPLLQIVSSLNRLLCKLFHVTGKFLSQIPTHHFVSLTLQITTSSLFNNLSTVLTKLHSYFSFICHFSPRSSGTVAADGFAKKTV